MADQAHDIGSETLLHQAPVDAQISNVPAARFSPRPAYASPSAKTKKQSSASKNKEERRLARETQQRESDDRLTSAELLDPIRYVFGKIDFDPCWHPASKVNPEKYLDVRQGHNGLREEWSGHLAFVNPPWSLQDKFLRRAYHQWKEGNVDIVVCVVPAKTDAKFFHDTLAKEADVYFLEGRPRFSKIDGTSEPTMVSVMVVMLGADSEQKARFAKAVRGSWLRPDRPSSVRAVRARTHSSGVVYDYGVTSCAAIDRDFGAIFCSSLAGASRSMPCPLQ